MADEKPDIRFDETFASTTPKVSPAVHAALVAAIEHKFVVTITTPEGTRLVEPHIYGKRGGRARVLVYEADAKEPWALLDATTITAADIDQTRQFAKRPVPAEFDA